MGESDNIEDVGYLQDIISYIFDEKKIVTYKWISNVLAIHVNRAKQLLYTFIKHISEERLKELQVTYLIGGILPNDRGCRLQVVSEDDLEKVKAQFKVITSEHIYSVSLKNCLVDLQNLCSVDGVKDSEVGRHGAVKCTKSISRTSQENASKRQGAYKSVEDDKKWPTAQTKQEKETSTGSNEKKSSKASNGISAMFAAQNGKKKAEDNTSPKKPDVKSGEKASPEKKVPVPKNSSKGGKPPANRLAAMFSAQNLKPKTEKKDVQAENKPKSEKEDSEKDTKVPENNSKVDEKLEKKKTDSKNTNEKSSKTKTKSESKKSKQKKRKASDNEEKSKKRKRIVVMDDSDSSGDDIFGSDNEEEEEDKSYSQPPPENEDEEMEEQAEVAAPKNSEPPEPDTNGHHARKRHLVDKTFMDEDGYMVTKKVYEYVSCSDSEGEKENEKALESKKNKTESESKDTKIETESKKLKTDKQVSKAVQAPQKNQKHSNHKKNSSPEKKKQATLMNFFKRS